MVYMSLLYDHKLKHSSLDLLQGIAKRLVQAAISEAARKREMRYDDIKHIGKGIRRHFHDDITVIVIYLDRNSRVGDSIFKDSRYGRTDAPPDIFSFNSE